MCGACRRDPPPHDRLHALWSFEPPLDAVMHAFKFARQDYLGDHLGRAMAGPFVDLASAADAVVPVPLHWRRQLARGYNQAELMARGLARRWQTSLALPLRRRRATAPQTGLEREARLANLRRAFEVRDRRAVAGLRLVLVDDVVTTGATLAAAAAALRRCGASAIIAVAAARTPPPGALPLASVNRRPGASPR